jgi:hypothetical protein
MSSSDLPLRVEAESESRNRKKQPEPASRRWWPVAAAFAIAFLLTGFVAGFFIGQQDVLGPVQRTEPPPVAGDPSRSEGTPTPTVGRDYTESPVPPAASGVERPAASGAERPAVTGAERPAVTGAERPAVSGVERPPAATEPAVIPPPNSQPAVAAPTRHLNPGTLQVDSRPRGAHVFVDGRLVGVTPLVVSDVTPGEHAVRIDLRGHRRWVTSVRIEPGERERVAASLER